MSACAAHTRIQRGSGSAQILSAFRSTTSSSDFAPLDSRDCDTRSWLPAARPSVGEARGVERAWMCLDT